MKPIDIGHPFYENIRDAIKSQQWDIIPSLVNVEKKVEISIDQTSVEKDSVYIKDDNVFYNSQRIHNSLTNRIVTMAAEGFDI